MRIFWIFPGFISLEILVAEFSKFLDIFDSAFQIEFFVFFHCGFEKIDSLFERLMILLLTELPIVFAMAEMHRSVEVVEHV